MCGITGIFNLNGEPASSVILRKMTDAIAHRGPDGEGFYNDSFIGFGHRIPSLSAFVFRSFFHLVVVVRVQTNGGSV